jgi:chemotaxis protein histidine kinase CheA
VNDRERQLERFRPTLKERVHTILTALHTGDLTSEETIRHEMHTLKGETRMLGLDDQSELAHAVEEGLARLFGDHGDPDEGLRASLTEALHVLSASLDESPQHVEDLGRFAISLRASNNTPFATTVGEATIEPGLRDAPESIDRKHPDSQARWIQVEATAVERLCSRIAELSTAYAGLSARAARGSSTLVPIGRNGVPEVQDELAQCRTLLDECTEAAWALRLTPVEPTLRMLGHHAERLARDAGNGVTVTVDGAGVFLEMDVLAQLWESLLHLVQNAIAHGLTAPASGARGPLRFVVEHVKPPKYEQPGRHVAEPGCVV